MRAKSNQFFASMLAAVFGSLMVVSGPVAMAQPPSSDPTPECKAGDFKVQGPFDCNCGPDGKWACNERGHGGV
ncbi:hypothetical protein ACQP0C_19790 [Nocardia sp. CA-129566]|uniref:hypothetical protein n=1 Tax=Nocardia sp. CA-129566 TaxID=3239976 RepID=UPI003D99BB6C